MDKLWGDLELKYVRYIIGLVRLGMGQQLIRTGFIEPWAEDRQSFLVLGILGLISLVVGLFLIGKLFLIMIKQYNQHNQVVTSVLVALGVSLIIYTNS
ncbi:hypothetical protein MKL26_06995 [Streptococcus suis]|nr:hypothetical protein [Streptococcus suis]